MVNSHKSYRIAIEIKLSIERNLYLASIDTDYGIYLFHGQDARTIALFVDHYIDTDLDLLDNDRAMNAIKKHKKLTSQLLDDAKLLLKDGFSENEFKLAFEIVKTAQSRTLLGDHKLSDCCLTDTVNIANHILRTRRFDEVELKTVTKQPKALYVYIGLVALGLIPAA